MKHTRMRPGWRRWFSWWIALLTFFVLSARVLAADTWSPSTPEEAGFDPVKLDQLWNSLHERGTTAFLLVRRDHIVFERYAAQASRTTPHYTASLAKALVGGLSTMLALDDQRFSPGDLASRFVPTWRDDPRKSQITLRHLATHTSGIEDAEEDNIPHEKLTGWKGDFWKRLSPPRDPFSLARDAAPVLDPPGTVARYSNPGMAMLAYCVTASLRGSPNADLRSLLRNRIMEPLDIPKAEWSIGYGADTELEGMHLVADWGGGAFSPRATALIGRLLLHRGNWNGRQLLSGTVIDLATRHAGMPNNSGLAWWVNRELDGSRHWQSAPPDAYWGAGAGHQFLLVIPSLDLVAVRYGDRLDATLSFDDALERHVVAPLMRALHPATEAHFEPSPLIRGITWAPKETIIRKAKGSDTWPMSWADDDALYTAYGDGSGFEPGVPSKLSMGIAKITGMPPEIYGTNIRSPTGEQFGDGARGRKASGLLAVDGVLYLWARNATNAQLAWSNDHGTTWTWSDWRFTTSFGCPTFLNFGKNYSGARDNFVYIFSQDSGSAYQPADRFVLARVPKNQITRRESYQFFQKLDQAGQPLWSDDIQQRGAVMERPGQCYRSGVSYNAPLKRYLWSQTLPGTDARFQGGFSIWDAPEPWGPWTGVFQTSEWDFGPGETSSFPAKWVSGDGKDLWLVFSGEDSLSVRKAHLELYDETQASGASERLRVIIETDAGGDPDDEQSLVRFLLYANEWDVEGIIANRPRARERENLNRERTGLGIVRAQLNAYEACYPNLAAHDSRYPRPERLWDRTVAGYDDTDHGVNLILAAVDDPDRRSIWFCNWGTDHGSATTNLKRALDRVLRERGPEGYARFKSRLRLSSADAFGEHTTTVEPHWSLWVDTFRPELEGKRWYHRFSALTAKAGGFDVERDVRNGHGPLGALYPLNTTHPQKEGDTMSFLYLVPTGMNDVDHPNWGSWAGRYGLNEGFPGRNYHWANVKDEWQGATSRDNVLARWAADLQNDFRARLDWCVNDYAHANHPPSVVLNGRAGKSIVRMQPTAVSLEPDQVVQLSAAGTTDPDGDRLRYEWWIYPEAGNYHGVLNGIANPHSPTTQLQLPPDLRDKELHVILTVRDSGNPPLASYRRLILFNFAR